MPIDLVSLTKRPQTFHLPHGSSSHRMQVQRAELQSDGAVAIREARLVVPGTITLKGRGKLENQPDAMATSPEVVAAVRAGHLRVEHKKEGVPSSSSASESERQGVVEARPRKAGAKS